MPMQFNNTLLLCPKKYSLFNSFTKVLREISREVTGFDVRDEISRSQMQVNTQMFRFPNKIRSKWEASFLRKINELILKEFNSVKPDLVFIYNSEYLLPETCAHFKKSARLIFFMGDSPFYTPVNNHYLALLSYGDLVLSPDSFWLEQIRMLGINRTGFLVPSIEKDLYFPIDPASIEKNIEETDILYVGMCYVNSWGYKKALLMNNLTKHNLKIYGGSGWKRWFKYFPDLESKFNLSDYIETEKLNKMFNRSKLIPVDGNPAIINGIHYRAFEALGAGTLPLIEYRKDVVEIVFKGFGKELPIIYDYTKASDAAAYYINNETERKDLAVKMRDFINEKYSIQNNADLLTDHLNKFQR